MTPERWARIEELFEACVALSPEARAKLLAAQCAVDPALVDEVESLLAHDDDGGTLDGVFAHAGRAAMATLDRYRTGDRIGVYALERALGQGGMGMVWLARRADAEFEQKVAIKLVATGGEERGWIEHFRAERQIMASLEHPHIARLLDGGTTPSGQPYLVMEYVEGEPLLAWCDRNRLGIAERLRLFKQVCDAVDYAHRRLIVHRDLKPANILVSREAGPKLLDFGIARMVQPAAGDAGNDNNTLDATRRQERLLTPNYASPEQLTGQPIDTASDIYSLGVLLFELLTGRRPRELEDLTPAAIERAVTEQPTTRPSAMARQPIRATDGDGIKVAAARSLKPSQLVRSLRGDLDTIVLKAMQVDPARRYRSSAELADDLQRHLDDRPVLAQPDSLVYRIGKLCRRRPWGVAAVALIVALGVAFVVSLVLQAERLATERDRALAAESEARAVSEFLIDTFRVADPGEARGETVTARELLDRGSERITAELRDQPGVQTAMMSTLGDVYFNLGLREQAAQMHAAALQRRIEQFGAAHPDAIASRDRLGDTLRYLSRFDQAEIHLRRALALREAADPGDREGLADSLNNLGLLLSTTGREREAEPLLRRALAIRIEDPGAAHALTHVTRMNLAQLLSDTGREPEAETHYIEVLDQRRRTLGRHPKTANSAQSLGTLYAHQGRYQQAKALLTEALEIRREVLPPGHPHLAVSLNELAYLLHDQLELDAAEAVYREMLAIDEAGSDGPTLGIAIGMNNLAALLRDAARYDETEVFYQKSLAMREQLLGVDSGSYRRVQASLGRLYLHMGSPAQARRQIESAVAWLRGNAREEGRLLVDTLIKLAELERSEGHMARARTALEEALAVSEDPDNRAGSRRPDVALELAWTTAESPETRGCIDWLAEAEQGFTRPTTLPLKRARWRLVNGICKAAVGNPGAARAEFEAALEILTPALPERNHWVRQVRDRLAR